MKHGTHIKNKNQRAFIMIEAFVAIGILLLCVPAALDSIQKGILTSKYAKDELVASYLAQEGLEIIRSRRDNNMLNLNQAAPSIASWLDGIDPATCGGAKGCITDVGYGVSDPVISSCTGACTGQLNINSNGIYAHNSGAGWTPTKYYRTVKVIAVATAPCAGSICPEEVNVTSTVTYNVSTLGTRSSTVTEDLYNWLKP